MPYQSPGAAFSSGIENFMAQRAAQKHQDLLDSLAQKREDRLAQADLEAAQERRDALQEHKADREEQAHARQLKSFEAMTKDKVKGDIPSMEEFQQAKDVGRESMFPAPPVTAPGMMMGRAEAGPTTEMDPNARPFIGSPVERQKAIEDKRQADYMKTLDPKSREFKTLNYELQTGKNAPAGMFEPAAKAAKTPIAGVVGKTPTYGFQQADGSIQSPTGEDITATFRPPQTAGERTIVNNFTKEANAAKAYEPTPADEEDAKDLAFGKTTWAQWRSVSGRGELGTKKREYQLSRARQLNPNFDPASFEAGQKFAVRPQTQGQLAAIDNVTSGVKDLLKFSDQASRTGVPLINSLVNKAGYNVGGKHYASFAAARKAFADELSGALGFGTASDMKLEMGLDLTDPNLSPDAFTDVITNVVEPFVQRKKASFLGRMGPVGARELEAQPKTGAAPKKIGRFEVIE